MALENAQITENHNTEVSVLINFDTKIGINLWISNISLKLFYKYSFYLKFILSFFINYD